MTSVYRSCSDLLYIWCMCVGDGVTCSLDGVLLFPRFYHIHRYIDTHRYRYRYTSTSQEITRYKQKHFPGNPQEHQQTLSPSMSSTIQRCNHNITIPIATQPTNIRVVSMDIRSLVDGSDESTSPISSSPSATTSKRPKRSGSGTAIVCVLFEINNNTVELTALPPIAQNSNSNSNNNSSIALTGLYTNLRPRRPLVMVGNQQLPSQYIIAPPQYSSVSTTTTPSPSQTHSAPPSARPLPYDHNQRRQAHIASEQKRRQSINNGFDGLRRIIPDCQNSLDSKAMILNKGINIVVYVQIILTNSYSIH